MPAEEEKKGTPRKRDNPDLAAAAAPTKRARITSVETINILGHVLRTVPPLSIKAICPLTMKVMVQNKMAITNEGGQQETSWNKGALLCAFGKGKFASQSSADDFDPEKEIMFAVKDGADPIIFNGALTTVGDILSKRRQTHNNAVVNYHDLTELEPGKFSFEQKHSVVFKPQGSRVAAAGGEGGEQRWRERRRRGRSQAIIASRRRHNDSDHPLDHGADPHRVVRTMESTRTDAHQATSGFPRGRLSRPRPGF